jgi:predicted XRE-type DNA-binding protein
MWPGGGDSMKIQSKEKITPSSGNVFQDLGNEDSDVLIIKAKLVQKMSEIIDERKMTQTQAAKVLGIDQPKISALLKGKLSEFSIEGLIQYLNSFDTKVELLFTSTAP